jgi:hypothetical protein
LFIFNKILYFFTENNSLSAIESIVAKFFTQTKKVTNKKRLISREFGTSVTDLDELALTTIKKKTKTNKTTTTTRKPRTSKKQKVVENPVDTINSPNNLQSSNDQHPAQIIHQSSNHQHPVQIIHQSTNNNITSTDLSSRPDFFPDNNSSSFTHTTTLQPLQNLTSMNMFKCHQCFRDLLPWEAMNNCAQCNAIICWQCVGFSDGSNCICHSCQNTYRFGQYLPL